MHWNLDNIRFLHPPDDFMGAFNNEKMQARHKALQEEKIKEIVSQLESEKNSLKAMLVLNSLEHLRFVLNNLEQFKKDGCLEKTVLMLFYRKNTPFAAAGDYDTWKFLLENCDPDLLSKQGEPFPHERVTAYRGSVTGLAKGLSWTISTEKVEWILDCWKDKELGGGTVFALDIKREDILVYVEVKDRKEVILLPGIAESAQPREITSL